MNVYEIRAQTVAPEESRELWHVVELNGLRALCGKTVSAQQSARPLAALADVDPECCCEPCEQIQRAESASVLDGAAGIHQPAALDRPMSPRIDVHGIEAGPGRPVGRPVEVDGRPIGVAVSHFDLMRLLGNHGIYSAGDAVWHGGDPTDWPERQEDPEAE